MRNPSPHNDQSSTLQGVCAPPYRKQTCLPSQVSMSIELPGELCIPGGMHSVFITSGGPGGRSIWHCHCIVIFGRTRTVTGSIAAYGRATLAWIWLVQTCCKPAYFSARRKQWAITALAARSRSTSTYRNSSLCAIDVEQPDWTKTTSQSVFEFLSSRSGDNAWRFCPELLRTLLGDGESLDPVLRAFESN